jgi:hypothetical protein
LPHVATALPAFVQAWMGMFNGPAGKFALGALPTIWTLTAPVYILGGLLFGIATFRAGILPRWAGALLALSTVLAPIAAALPNASQPKIAIPMGVALAWLGYALWSEPRPQPLNGAPRIRQKREAPTGLLMLGHGPAVSFRAAAARRSRSASGCSARLWVAK